MSNNPSGENATAEPVSAENPAIRPQPNGDVDIVVPEAQAEDAAQDPSAVAADEASTNPENLDHPEELMGE